MNTNDMGTLLTWLAVIPTHWLVLRHARLPWWKSAVGRSFMGVTAGLAILVWVALARYYLGENLVWLNLIRLATISLVVFSLWYQVKAFRDILVEHDEDIVAAHAEHDDDIGDRA